MTVPRGRVALSQEKVVLLVTVVLVVTFGATVPGFLTAENLVTLARSVSVLGIFGIAMAVVVVAGGIDLSLVAAAGVATAVSVQWLGDPGASTLGAIGAGLVLAVAIGVANGLVIAFVEVPALFATLASGLFVYGASRAFFLSGMIVEVPPGREAFRFLGQGHPFGVPMPVVILGAVAIAVHLFLSYTSVGRFVYAHGDNAETASLTGIPIRPLTCLEYAAAAAIGFFGGLVMAASVDGFNVQVIDSTLIYDVLLVVVVGGISLVGGRGGVGSVLCGILLIGVMLNGMTLLDWNLYQQNIVKGLILLAALVLDNRLHPRDEETVRQGD